jgi:hypothetical protein
MIKILGSIASSAMSSKGKEESKPKPKLNSNFLIDADKQASQAPLNINAQTASAMVNVVNLNSTKRGQKLSKRLTKRNQKRTERIDNRELRRKARFESRDANQGKTYQEKRGTDVGNFFRKMKNPAASQNPPTNGGNTGATNYDDKKQEENIKLNTNWNIGGSTEDYLNSQFYKTPGYMGNNLDHTTVSLQNNKK